MVCLLPTSANERSPLHGYKLIRMHCKGHKYYCSEQTHRYIWETLVESIPAQPNIEFSQASLVKFPMSKSIVLSIIATV